MQKTVILDCTDVCEHRNCLGEGDFNLGSESKRFDNCQWPTEQCVGMLFKITVESIL